MADAGHNIAAETEKLLWIDCEFTGLSIEDDIILEIAAVATDYQLNQLGTYSAFIQQDDDLVKALLSRNEWWQERPDHQRVMSKAVHELGKPAKLVEEELIEFADSITDEPIVLAGNSIYNDRQFVVRDFTEFASKLHYRMVDVSGFKLVVNALLKKKYEKNEAHRALEDIQESIDELHFLLNTMGNQSIRELISDRRQKQSQIEDHQPHQD